MRKKYTQLARTTLGTGLARTGTNTVSCERSIQFPRTDWDVCMSGSRAGMAAAVTARRAPTLVVAEEESICGAQTTLSIA